MNNNNNKLSSFYSLPQPPLTSYIHTGRRKQKKAQEAYWSPKPSGGLSFGVFSMGAYMASGAPFLYSLSLSLVRDTNKP